MSLAKNAQTIMVQFAFSNADLVPHSLRRLPHESLRQAYIRSASANGEMVVEPTENVDLVVFLDDLQQNGYKLVDGIYQKRPDYRNPNKTYNMVRFVFSSQAADKPMKQDISRALQTLAEEASWTTKVYFNPIYIAGQAVEGKINISVNLMARKPYRSADGQPVKQWRRDTDGRKVGDGPLPIQPDRHLRIAGDTITTAPLQQKAAV